MEVLPSISWKFVNQVHECQRLVGRLVVDCRKMTILHWLYFVTFVFCFYFHFDKFAFYFIYILEFLYFVLHFVTFVFCYIYILKFCILSHLHFIGFVFYHIYIFSNFAFCHIYIFSCFAFLFYLYFSFICILFAFLVLYFWLTVRYQQRTYNQLLYYENVVRRLLSQQVEHLKVRLQVQRC